MATFNLSINGRPHMIEADPQMPLLWALRDIVGLTGTKYGCGVGVCGSCVVHLDGKAVRSCITSVADAEGQSVLTIEGLAALEDHPVIQAWLAEDVPQCGYCQPGQIMTAAALLAATPRPTAEQMEATMANLVCRCGTYARIRSALARALGEV